MKIVTKDEALRQDLSHYYTGKPCRNSHISKRHISGKCLACDAERSAQRYLKTPEIVKSHNANWRNNNSERMKELTRRWNKKYPETRRLYTANRKAAKLQRTPKWAELELIKAFYEACPEGYHVDHVIPLRGEFVSGLHTLENLQYLTALENHIKGNRHEADTSSDRGMAESDRTLD